MGFEKDKTVVMKICGILYSNHVLDILASVLGVFYGLLFIKDNPSDHVMVTSVLIIIGSIVYTICRYIFKIKDDITNIFEAVMTYLFTLHDMDKRMLLYPLIIAVISFILAGCYASHTITIISACMGAIIVHQLWTLLIFPILAFRGYTLEFWMFFDRLVKGGFVETNDSEN